MSSDGNIGEVSGVVFRIRSSQQQFSSDLSSGVSVEVEAEHRGLDAALADHVVEGRNHAVDSNVGVAHAQDTIKLGSDKGHAWLRESLSEGLVLDINSTK